VFADEKIGSLTLEEVEFDDKAGSWSVTIGFSRPWEDGTPTTALGFMPKKRDSKVVRITDADHRIISVKNREAIDG
jgi:hypothetical protein